MVKLNKKQIDQKLAELKNWYLDGEAIKREWIFDDFNAALDFINKVGQLAEQYAHHPEIFNVYNKVSLRFFTHSENGLTEKDFLIAAAIDRI